MRRHWIEYAIEGLCLALFMVSATVFATALQHPRSPLALSAPLWRHWPMAARIPMGVAMGLTAIALIYSPFGRRSGAHMNPAVTLAYAWLGRIPRQDVAGYLAGQFIGGTVGLLGAVILLRHLPADPSVQYVATTPGPLGLTAAFAAETGISFLMMRTVLALSSRPASAPFTGLAAGALVALFITIEAPLSGMSMNPARSLASNLLAGQAGTLWIYFTAPPLGMLAGAVVFGRRVPAADRPCPKLRHTPDVRCIFCGQTPSAPVTLRETRDHHD